MTCMIWIFIKNFNTTSSSHLFHVSSAHNPRTSTSSQLKSFGVSRRLMSLSVMPYSCRFAPTILWFECEIHEGYLWRGLGLELGDGGGMFMVTVSGTFVMQAYPPTIRVEWRRLANQMCHASSCKKYQPNQLYRTTCRAWRLTHSPTHTHPHSNHCSFHICAQDESESHKPNMCEAKIIETQKRHDTRVALHNFVDSMNERVLKNPKHKSTHCGTSYYITLFGWRCIEYS